MDAVKFLEEASRMCRQVGNCINCQLVDDLVDDTIECRIDLKRTLDHEEAEDCVKIVEEWAKKHMSKTRAGKFKMLFPNSSVYNLCVKFFDTSIGKCDQDCIECIKRFWGNESIENE